MEINFVNEFPKTLGCVVEYNGKKYLLWHVNSFGKAQLMKPDGTKFSGTPEVDKLKWLYQVPIVHFNRVDYAVDIKQRIISLATGKICFESGTVREFILEQANQSEIVKIHADYDMGFLTFREFYHQTISEIKEHIQKFFPPDYRIVY
ncbi:MAG: hypothetical protein IPF54_26925 [Draconibacterium sp.]|nr:hypothetical protein [Draconibacterium sp.]